MKRIVARVATVALSLLITLGLLELGIRIAKPRYINYWDSRAIRRLGSAPPHFVENIPNGRATFIGVPVAINSQGLRGDEFGVPKPRGTIRVLVVGDSISFGYGIRNEYTYAKVLEKLLNEKASGLGLRYEVLNGSALGGSLSDYYHFLNTRADALQPDVVVIGLCLNDILVYQESGAILGIGSKQQDKRWSAVRGFSGFFLRHSRLYLYCYAHLKSILYEVGLVNINDVQGLNFVALAPPNTYQNQAWESSLGMLTHIKEFCQQRGYRFAVVVFPMQMQLSHAQYEFYRKRYHLNLDDEASLGRPQQLLRQFAQGTNMSLVDLLPRYRAYDSDSLYLRNEMIPADPTHPSAKGNEVAAEEIVNQLSASWFLSVLAGSADSTATTDR